MGSLDDEKEPGGVTLEKTRKTDLIAEYDEKKTAKGDEQIMEMIVLSPINDENAECMSVSDYCSSPEIKYDDDDDDDAASIKDDKEEKVLNDLMMQIVEGKSDQYSEGNETEIIYDENV